jgi:hypothetical protein
VSKIFLEYEVKLEEVMDLDPKVQSIISSQQTNTTDNNHMKCKFQHFTLGLREQFYAIILYGFSNKTAFPGYCSITYHTHIFSVVFRVHNRENEG